MEDLKRSLVAQRELVRVAFEQVPAPLRATVPAVDRWSAVQVVHHLAMVEGRIASMLEQFVAKAPPRVETRELPPMKDLSPIAARSRRVTVVPGTEPGAAPTADEAWSALAASRERLLRVMDRLADVDVDGMTYPHPFIGPLDAREWILFVGWHEERHANQILEIVEQVST